MPDFHRICKRFHRGIAGLEDVVRVYQAVQLLPLIVEALDSIKETHANGPLLDEIYTDAMNVSPDSLTGLTRTGSHREASKVLRDGGRHNRFGRVAEA